MTTPATKLIFGCGYVGQRVARAWQQRGHQVAVVTRSVERAVAFHTEGLLPIVADVTDPASLESLPNVETVLFAVGYDRRQSLHSIEEVYAQGLQNMLASIGGRINRLIYISSTGVYGATEGEWVNEQDPPAPTREGGRACLAAEQILLAHEAIPARVILRLAGIYGPGRIPNREDLMMGKPLQNSPDGWLNLIHVEDAVRVVLAADQLSAGVEVFNVADGVPVRRIEYYRYLAELLNAPPPQFIPPGPDASERSRGGANRRICNIKLLESTGVSLRYPSYREGLAAIVREL